MTRKKYLLLLFTIILLTALYFPLDVTRVKAAITLLSFEGLSGNQQAILTWETATEADMLGFYILRSEQINGDFSRVSSFIFTQGSPISGGIYRFEDNNLIDGKSYFYKLEAIDNQYQSEFFGPITVIPGQPGSTKTATGTITPTKTNSVSIFTNTNTLTHTITAIPTIFLTKTQTETLSPTSPFSFITNTATASATTTPLPSNTPLVTQTPELSVTPEATKTFRVLSFNMSTPTMVPTSATNTHFQSGLLGFLITVVIGIFLIIILFIVQRKIQSD